MSEETKKKMCIARARQAPISPEGRLRISLASKGRKPSEETIQLRRETRKANKKSWTEEARLKMSLKCRGRKHTEETKNKLSEITKKQRAREKSLALCSDGLFE